MCDLIAVTLQGRRGEDITIQALSFLAICLPLQAAFVVDQYSHLRDIDLADYDTDGGCSDSIDILIGSNYYWHVVIGDIIRSDIGPLALNSRLGWLVSGPTSL